MSNMTNDINSNVDTKTNDDETIIINDGNSTFSKEMSEALKEINEMINNSEKYPRYNNRKDLKKALLSED